MEFDILVEEQLQHSIPSNIELLELVFRM